MVILYPILAVLVIAVAVFLVKRGTMHVTVFVATALVALLLPLPTYAIGTAIAKSDQQTFHEYWNGYEVSTNANTITCTRDGACVHTYNCDPYQVHTTETYTDSDGKTRTRPKTETRYHDCPYSRNETTYVINTTLGDYTVASHLMTGPAYRFGQYIPGGQVKVAPQLWREAKARIDAGKSGGVTKVSNYKNYILASQSTVFKRYSDRIDALKAKNLLPAPSAGVTDFYQASKAYFVGNLNGINRKAMVKDVQNLNGAVGTDLHGDLNVVFVDTAKVKMSSEDYGNALMAYWQSKEFGRDALAKNTVVLIVGVKPYQEGAGASVSASQSSDKSTPTPADSKPAQTIKAGTPVVDWAAAFTGMPVGNEALLNQFHTELPGTVVGKNFIGNPTYNTAKQQVIRTDGVVESILYGQNKFVRVSMTGGDKDDSGSGFSYLSAEWKPDTGTLVAIYSVSVLLFLGALIGGAYTSITLVESNTNDIIRKFFGKGNNK